MDRHYNPEKARSQQSILSGPQENTIYLTKYTTDVDLFSLAEWAELFADSIKDELTCVTSEVDLERARCPYRHWPAFTLDKARLEQRHAHQERLTALVRRRNEYRTLLTEVEYLQIDLAVAMEREELRRTKTHIRPVRP